MLRILFCIVLLSAALSMDAQEYNHIQYTIANGLPSNTVYDVKQDADGFIWVGTDAGLARFDGRNFVTFTTRDGLPSNDVLVLFPDTKGRMWISTLHNSICYHYKGKIHSYKNDTMLKRMTFAAIPHLMRENKAGDVMIGSGDVGGLDMYVVKANNRVVATHHPTQYLGSAGIQTGEAAHEFIASYYDTINKVISNYSFDGEKWEHKISFSRYLDTIKFFTIVDGKPVYHHYKIFSDAPGRHLRYDERTNIVYSIEHAHLDDRISVSTQDGWKIFAYGTSRGSFILDTITGNISDHLLPGKVTNRAYPDREGNIWVCTNSEGLALFPSRQVRSLPLPGQTESIYSLYSAGGVTYAGSANSNLYIIRDNKVSKVNFDRYIKISNNQRQDNILRRIEPSGKSKLILGFDDFILKYDPISGKTNYCKVDVTKHLFTISPDTVLAATGRATLLLNSNFNILDTILSARSYSALRNGNAYYVGTTNGPVKIVPGHPPVNLSTSQQELNTQINYMEMDPDGSIWMSSTGNGIFKIRNDKIEEWINASNGLNSNNCKAMYLDGKFLWVGTEKGLNRINRAYPSEPIQQYTVEDGLASNDIHSIFSDRGTIYLGTDGRLTWFDSSKMKTPSICKLQLLDVELGKRSISIDSLKGLKYNENNLKFYFTALSFKSSSNIVYLYHLKGLSDTWDSTFNSNLEFLALPPGEYQLELFARNKFGQNSNVITIPFLIKPPFWATWWFRIVILGSVIAITWWIIVRRIRREQEKSAVQNRLNELEQQALRSQMNPHFIFNCLNSIQNFLLQNNFEKTNEYLTAFAQLIRQTLDNSSRSSISLESEIRYLNSYLELESMRFAHSFVHSIELDSAIDADRTFIPTMILQPYVENSIRHGLRYRQEGAKMVKVIFKKRGNTLLCIVEDNGIGRRKAAELKSFMHVEYQSKGMTLTAERIAALNRRQDIPITVDVIDMEEDGNATGTQVIVRFPNVFL
ncbi:MAG: histidine kinase [Chitinophagaceae bacterium]|nr:histidine kinase [Chitinophagaceae bacterium]